MNKLNSEKINQVIDYIKLIANKHLSFKEIFAIIYLVDRYHLRKYGSLMIGGNTIPEPEGYAIIDESLLPINLEVAHHLGLHPEEKETFLIELDMMS